MNKKDIIKEFRDSFPKEFFLTENYNIFGKINEMDFVMWQDRQLKMTLTKQRLIETFWLRKIKEDRESIMKELLASANKVNKLTAENNRLKKELLE